MLHVNRNRADALKGYTIVRTKKFLITLNHGWKKSSIKYYLEDMIDPFLTFLRGLGLILLFVPQLIVMIYKLLPKIIIIKD
jgi:hypothetical protein